MTLICMFFFSENRHALRYIHRKTCFETYIEALPLFYIIKTGVLVTVTVAAAQEPPFHWHGLVLVPAGMSNRMPGKVGSDCLSVPGLQRLHRCSLGVDGWFHLTLCNGCDCVSMLGLELDRVSERGHRCPVVRSVSVPFGDEAPEVPRAPGIRWVAEPGLVDGARKAG